MSTTIKRIALVAVAALGLGVMSVAPSQAADNLVLAYDSGDSAGTENNTGFGVAGAFNYVTVKVIGSPSADYVLTTTSSFISRGTIGADSATITSDGKTITTVGAPTGTGIRVATPAVGTVTVSYYKRTGTTLATTPTESVVFTINATAQSGTFSAAKSTVFIASGETSTAVTADAAVTKVSTVDTNTAAGTIQVLLKDALGNAINDTVTATIISGPGTINGSPETSTAGNNWNQVDNQYSKSVLTTTGGRAYFGIYANGQSGTSVVSLRISDGTTIGQKSVTFSSTTVATITVVVKKKTVLAATSPATTGVFSVTLKDATGNAVNNVAAPTVTAATGTTVGGASSCTWDETSTAYLCQVVGLAADKFGPVEYTFTHSSASATAVNAKASTTFSSNVANTLTIVGGSGAAGGEVAYTVTAKDANGYAVPDGTAVGLYISSVSTVGGIVKEIDTTTATSVDGVFTVKGTAPIVSTTLVSTFNLSGTAGAASTYFVKALAGTKPTAEFVVANASQDAAIDAANEAATAAQDATDAAIQAADAADEAIAAVAALSLEVNKLVAGLKKQLTTLTNLVKNLQKAVARR
jgi:hypothetical protein